MSDVLRALSVMQWCSRHGFIHYPGVEKGTAMLHAMGLVNCLELPGGERVYSINERGLAILRRLSPPAPPDVPLDEPEGERGDERAAHPPEPEGPELEAP